MQPDQVTYYSHGIPISAHYWRPESTDERTPALVFCPGFTGTKTNPVYQLFVGPLTAAGYGVLVPDYRGWGDSGGEPGAIYPLDQVDDLRAGLSYLETRPDVLSTELGLFGVSFGGGHATYLAGIDSRVRAAVAVSGVGDGSVWLRSMRSEGQWQDYLRDLDEDRRARARSGSGRLVDPTEAIMIASPERHALKGAGSSARTPLACADAIMDYRPVEVAARIAPRAVLWMCVERDPVVPAEHSRMMYAAAGEPKKLVVFPGDQHYAGYERFQAEICAHTLDWLDAHLH